MFPYLCLFIHIDIVLCNSVHTYHIGYVIFEPAVVDRLMAAHRSQKRSLFVEHSERLMADYVVKLIYFKDVALVILLTHEQKRLLVYQFNNFAPDFEWNNTHEPVIHIQVLFRSHHPNGAGSYHFRSYDRCVIFELYFSLEMEILTVY